MPLSTMSHRLALLCVLFLIGVQSSAAQVRVTVTGSAELLETSNHAGIEVFFEPLSPSAVAATILTESDGFYVRTDVPVGIYNIRVSKDGYVPGIIPNVFIDADTNFELISLRPGGTAEIGGSIRGTLSGDTLYTVTETLTVPSGASLIIEGGAELQFSRNTGLIVDGELRVTGTDQRSVLFTSAAPVPDFSDWRGVRLRKGTIDLSHVTILFAHSPITSRIWDDEWDAEPDHDDQRPPNEQRVRADYLIVDEVAINQVSINLPDISGITLENCTARARNASVIDISWASRVKIDNCDFRDGHPAINGDRAEDVTLTNSKIIDYRQIAVRAAYAQRWSIVGNQVKTKYETDLVYSMSVGTVIIIDRNTITLRDDGQDGVYKTGLVTMGTGSITNNDISIHWSGRNSVSSGPIFRLGATSVRDNKVIIRSSRPMRDYRLIELSSGELIRNHIDIRTTNSLHGLGDNSLGIDSYASSRITTSQVDSNYISIHSSTSTQLGIIFDLSQVRDNMFVIRSQDEWGGSSYYVQNSEFKNNVVLTESPVDVNRSEARRASVIAIGGSSMQDNTIIGESGVYAHAMTAAGSIRNNLIITREGDPFGVISTAGSGGSVFNNTIANGRHGGRGIRIDSEATTSVMNNVVNGFDIGVLINSPARSITYNNIYGAAEPFSGSYLPAYIGNVTTMNHLGTPSDIYYNTFVDPLFVAPADTNYHLQSTSPLVNAGSPDIRKERPH